MIKTIIPLLLLIILGGTYFYTKNNDQDTSIKIEDRDFVVEDIEQIDIIVIKRPRYPEIHLSKSSNGWILNQRRKASSHVLTNLLRVLTQLELDYVPPRTMYNKIMTDIEKLGIDVTTYDKEGNVLSDFIVGNNTRSEGGTYFLKKGAKQPYVMVVPFVSGGIRNYFTMTDVNFRDKFVLDVNSADIEKVTLDYKKNRVNSFVIKKEKNRKYKVEALVPGPETFDINQNQNLLDAYIKNFKKFGAESIMTGFPEIDSLRHQIPFLELKIDLTNGRKIEYSFHPITNNLGEGNDIRTVFDLKKAHKYRMLSADGESYVVQQGLVKNLFKPLGYFDQ